MTRLQTNEFKRRLTSNGSLNGPMTKTVKAVEIWLELHASELPLEDFYDLSFEKRTPMTVDRDLKDEVVRTSVDSVSKSVQIREGGDRTE
jgi:hypothetical protein